MFPVPPQEDTRLLRPPDPLRLYAIVRMDLSMSPGKLASQAGHAYVDALRSAEASKPELLSEYFNKGHGIKICLACPNLDRLLRAYEKAASLGLPCALVTDLGYTVFEGKPTLTAVGVGPARHAHIRQVTKRFQLMI